MSAQTSSSRAHQPIGSTNKRKAEARLVQGWKMLHQARELFEGALPPDLLPDTWQDQRREFSAVDYLSLLLIGLFNPSVNSLRGLCAASDIKRIRLQWGCQPMKLASVSDAQHLVNPDLLRPVISALSQRVQSAAQQNRIPDPALSQARKHQFAAYALRVVDSTVIEALPRMIWAAYGAGRPRADGKVHTGVRLHLSFDPMAQCPVQCHISEGKICERTAWENDLRPDPPCEEQTNLEMGDRNYGASYTLLERHLAKGVHFLVRLRSGAHEVAEEISVSAEEAKAGIQRQAWVRLGIITKRPGRATAPLVRVIWLASGVILATSLSVAALSASEASAMYRQRWQVEFFFKWIKTMLACKHWWAQSKAGVTLQLYLTIIAALLLQLKCGRRPSKRMMELLQYYFAGLLSARELKVRLKEAARIAVLSAASEKAYRAKREQAKR